MKYKKLLPFITVMLTVILLAACLPLNISTLWQHHDSTIRSTETSPVPTSPSLTIKQTETAASTVFLQTQPTGRQTEPTVGTTSATTTVISKTTVTTAAPVVTTPATTAATVTQQTTILPTVEVTPEPTVPATVTVTFSVDARNVLNNPQAGQKSRDIMNVLINSGRASANGSFYGPGSLTLPYGSTVFAALQATGLSIGTNGSGSGVYISSIQGLSHFDGGQDSGWMYLVNGRPPNVGAGAYVLKPGDVVSWRYTITGGPDVFY